MRVGNLLYLWLHAYTRTATGETVLVRGSRESDEWCQVFPALQAYSLGADQIRFSDRREFESTWLYQRFGVDFSRDQLQEFVHAVLAPSLAHTALPGIVVNVRRGDFYGTAFEAKHGFDSAAYVRAAIQRFDAGQQVHVVSDDPPWCRAHLGEILSERASAVTYAEPDPARNLATLASSTQIVGANSTFSYWGAYIADALHSDAHIVMPKFHARMAHGTDAHQLDPRWAALPGFY